MTHPRLIRIAGMLYLLGAAPAWAQHWNFQTYNAKQGLTNANILALKQDQEGFIWVSTEGGLYRYDGDRFRVVPAERPNKKSDIISLYLSADGQLWAGSTAGLFRWSGSAFASVPGFENMEVESQESISGDAHNVYVASALGIHAMPLKGGPVRRLSG